MVYTARDLNRARDVGDLGGYTLMARSRTADLTVPAIAPTIDGSVAFYGASAAVSQAQTFDLGQSRDAHRAVAALDATVAELTVFVGAPTPDGGIALNGAVKMGTRSDFNDIRQTGDGNWSQHRISIGTVAQLAFRTRA